MASVVPELPVLARDQAFENLYRRYVRDVYYYALAMLRNPADAEDVTQTTFLNAYRAYKRGDEILKPQNWLIKIAHNVARTRYARASRRVKEVPLEDHVDRLAVPEEDRPNVEGVLRALGRLPFNQRAAIVMRELEGRTYAEIADTLGVSVSAVETLIFRARRSLRLRGSAIRVLTVVPLPGSLSQLLQSGAVVAGGGALAGMGFVAKAVVALVVGAMATGVGGDKAARATAASDSRAPAVDRPADVVRTDLISRGTANSSNHARLTTGEESREGLANASGSKLGGGETLGLILGTSGTSAATTSSPASVAAQIAAAASSVVGSAENAAPPASLPVEVPSLPATPVVEAPPLPTVSLPAPSLPAPSLPVPSLPVQPPSLPALPVPLPSPPPLPKLP
jgi:RNA polymerase sigma factor (sigma-70 family)